METSIIAIGLETMINSEGTSSVYNFGNGNNHIAAYHSGFIASKIRKFTRNLFHVRVKNDFTDNFSIHISQLFARPDCSR